MQSSLGTDSAPTLANPSRSGDATLQLKDKKLLRSQAYIVAANAVAQKL